MDVKGNDARLKWIAHDAAAICSLVDPLGSIVPVGRWEEFETPQSLLALASLAGMRQSGDATVMGANAGIAIPANILSCLDDELADALGLPTAVPFMFEINAIGHLGNLKLEGRWRDARGLRQRDLTRKGCFLQSRDTTYRLPSPFYEVSKALDAFNARIGVSAADQARAWGEIQDLIRARPEHFEPSKFLRQMRVVRANRFTLDFVRGEDGGFQIAPVPLAAAITSKQELSLFSDGSSEPVRVLSYAEQVKFQQAFQGRAEVQAQYLGGDDVYVLLSPDVQRSLDTVRRIQKESPEKRLAFAQNPFQFLGHGADEESPFYESRSFSDRVTGLGLIEKVTLPWQILGSHGWLPPQSIDVELKGHVVRVPTADLESAIVEVELAIVQGRAEASVAGLILPATVDTRDELLAARMLLDVEATGPLGPSEPKQNAEEAILRKQRVGLQLKRNLDEAEYAATLMARSQVDFALPAIRSTLKDHQLSAVRWLQQRWAKGHRGALLADDMGLGKSLSALSFMIWLRGAMRAGILSTRPMLIVAPVSLLDNWQAEHLQHIGDSPERFIDIVPAYGANLRREGPGRDVDTGAAMLNMGDLTIDRFGKPTCVLTTYETLRDYQQSFAAIRFGLVVLDEAQRVKNPASLSWHAVGALHADFWLALTGTPVENRLADLWAIADILEPSYLGSLRTFSAKYEGEFDPQALADLKRQLEQSPDGAPFMLRRLKEHVLDGIPTKHEQLHAREMPPVQVAAYSDVVQSANDKIAPKQMLAVVQQLRETSLHPLKPTSCSPTEYIASSARFEALFSLLDDIRSKNEAALIFLDRNLIEAYLARLIQVRYSLPDLPPIINGNVAGHRRSSLVKTFQAGTGFQVMILSPRAGGVGLTLTAANHVIHLSRWWNPAVEDQSTDRVYRIGQKKPVYVHYLQATLPGQPDQSFDERLHMLLQKKRSLSRDLLWPFESESSDSAALLGRTGAPALTE